MPSSQSSAADTIALMDEEEPIDVEAIQLAVAATEEQLRKARRTFVLGLLGLPLAVMFDATLGMWLIAVVACSLAAIVHGGTWMIDHSKVLKELKGYLVPQLPPARIVER
jgi:hypothetical protein